MHEGKGIPNKNPNGRTIKKHTVQRTSKLYTKHCERTKGQSIKRRIPLIAIKRLTLRSRFATFVAYILFPKKLPVPIQANNELKRIDKETAGEPR